MATSTKADSFGDHGHDFVTTSSASLIGEVHGLANSLCIALLGEAVTEVFRTRYFDQLYGPGRNFLLKPQLVQLNMAHLTQASPTSNTLGRNSVSVQHHSDTAPTVSQHAYDSQSD